MKIHDQMTLRELEDGMEREGFAVLKIWYFARSSPQYEAVLRKGDHVWTDGEGASIAEAISVAYQRSKEPA